MQWGARGRGHQEDEGTLVGIGDQGGVSIPRWGVGKGVGQADDAGFCFDHVQSEELQGPFGGRWPGLWTFEVGT